jgi:tRNA pseudouridine38-40 synthase
VSGEVSDLRSEEGERCFRLVLEYEGTDFEGWQAQKGPRSARTVQAVLAEALESIVDRPGRLRGAGRTDAGVHALGQVASLRVATGLAPEALLRALNARLPADVAVREMAEVPLDWDALREARSKHYRYQIWNGRRRSPLRAARWHWVREPLDRVAMQSAAGVLEGRHDFAAFQGTGSSVRTTVRTLESLQVEGRTGAEIRLEVQGEGFLRHMVRNLAGTLIEVGRGRWGPERVAGILASRDRAQAGPTAPALGLVLVAVRDSWSEGEVGRGAESGEGASDGPPERRVDDVDEGDPVG